VAGGPTTWPGLLPAWALMAGLHDASSTPSCLLYFIKKLILKKYWVFFTFRMGMITFLRGLERIGVVWGITSKGFNLNQFLSVLLIPIPPIKLRRCSKNKAREQGIYTHTSYISVNITLSLDSLFF
jgi:hypothetical protein